ncbi:MAG: alpha/beta fold hydrolase [Deltaproteobacteria bacterium]|nr:alpha/beta fold hydrolase [Deltaproteobacteria bacterium]
MPTIEVNGTTLFYVDTGPGTTGETIAFSHGLLWGTELFAAQIEALRGRYRCIAWDHRGQGQSAPDLNRECIGMELVWQDAVALLEKLGTGAVHFCGLSMGGFVGMRMAARRPDLVRSLMLLETSSDPEPVENLKRYRLLISVVKMFGPGVVRGQVAPIMLGRTILTDASRRKERGRYTALMSRRRDGWRAVNGVVDRAGIHDELARISTRTLIVVGDEDVATPLPRAEKIAHAIAGSRLVQIPRAGHSSPVEEPAAVTAAIESFLAG